MLLKKMILGIFKNVTLFLTCIIWMLRVTGVSNKPFPRAFISYCLQIKLYLLKDLPKKG